jgi:transcriptional regulator with XRE-family HTH domain
MAKKDIKEVDSHVGALVRDRRMALGMSQTALGEAIGLTFQQVQKYEKGVNRIGSSRLVQIANALKVSPTFFFDGAPTALKLVPSPSRRATCFTQWSRRGRRSRMRAAATDDGRARENRGSIPVRGS